MAGDDRVHVLLLHQDDVHEREQRIEQMVQQRAFELAHDLVVEIDVMHGDVASWQRRVTSRRPRTVSQSFTFTRVQERVEVVHQHSVKLQAKLLTECFLVLPVEVHIDLRGQLLQEGHDPFRCLADNSSRKISRRVFMGRNIVPGRLGYSVVFAVQKV